MVGKLPLVTTVNGQAGFGVKVFPYTSADGRETYGIPIHNPAQSDITYLEVYVPDSMTKNLPPNEGLIVRFASIATGANGERVLMADKDGSTAKRKFIGLFQSGNYTGDYSGVYRFKSNPMLPEWAEQLVDQTMDEKSYSLYEAADWIRQNTPYSGTTSLDIFGQVDAVFFPKFLPFPGELLTQGEIKSYVDFVAVVGGDYIRVSDHNSPTGQTFFHWSNKRLQSSPMRERRISKPREDVEPEPEVITITFEDAVKFVPRDILLDLQNGNPHAYQKLLLSIQRKRKNPPPEPM